MKKLSLLIALMAVYLTGFAQSITVPNTVESGKPLIITASNESDAGFIANVFYYATPAYSTSPANQSVIFSQSQMVGYPWSTSGQPTKYSLSLTLSSTSAVTTSVTFTLRVVVGNNNGANQTTTDITVTTSVTPAQNQVWHNTAKTATFTKNNCGTGFQGSSVSYTVAANTYSSTVSQADADQKASNALNSEGQANANANGTCLPLFYNVAQTASFTKNDCVGASVPGAPISFTIPAAQYSALSQTEANNKAVTALNTQGQANANAQGLCNPVTIYKKVVASNYQNGDDPNVAYTTADYTVYFYADAAKTIPFTLQSTGYSFTYSEVTKTTRPGKPQVVTTRNYTVTAGNGSSNLLLGNFVITDCPSSPSPCITKTITLVN
ncbi:DUF5977 domain-containing protein [Pedobacter sp. P26]|uniref:DUF5977 domain-containing protein n=1 Tax=Pedobacter sp. P26 TaxID=3423956 RepID=UPI003D66EC96